MKIRAIFGWFVWLTVVAGGSPAPAAAAIGDYPFRLINREAGMGREAVAENGGPSPITVNVTISGENLVPDGPWPITAVVPPNTTLSLGRVYARDKTAGRFECEFHYSYHFGRHEAVPDPDAAYRLPFEDGHAFMISQAYGGTLTTHDNRASLHAVDFAMPAGSLVTAARAGVVVDVTLRYQDGGYDISYLDRANTITIVHDDGTVAEYAHLSPGPALVTPGQRVAAGETLGSSGNTGYSGEAHLHFIVTRPVVSEGQVSRVSVPVLFYATTPAVRFSAQMGTTVRANYGGAYTADRSLRPMKKGLRPVSPGAG